MNHVIESIFTFSQQESRIWWALAQASLIALTAYLLVIIARRVSPACRVYISLLGLLLMATMPVMTLTHTNNWSWGQLLHSSVVQTESPSMDSLTPAILVGDNASVSLTFWERFLVTTSAVFTERAGEVDLESANIEDQTLARTTTWLQVALSCLIFCIAFGVIRLMAGYWQIRTLRNSARSIDDTTLLEEIASCCQQMGIRSKLLVGETNALGSAAVIGCMKPLLLLPRTWKAWTADERRAVLAHELAHVKRRDFLSTAIGQLAVAFNFYHPLAHIVLQRLRLDQELAADSLAAQVVGGQLRYVELLAGLALRQAEVRTPGPCQAFLPPRRMFVRRLEMLRTLPQGTLWLNRCYSAIAIFTLTGIAGLATGMRPNLVVAQGLQPKTATTGPSLATGIRSLAQYLPQGLCEAVVVLDAQSILGSPGFKVIEEQAALPDEFNLPGRTVVVRDIEQVLIALPTMQTRHGPLVIIRMKNDFANGNANPQSRLLDSKTLAVCDDAKILELLGLGNGDAQWEALLDKNAQDSIRIATNTTWLQTLVAKDSGGPMIALTPLWKNVRTITAGIALGNDVELTAQLDTSDPKKVSETLTALKWLARNYVESLPSIFREQGQNSPTEMVIASTAATAGVQFLDSLVIKENAQQVDVAATLSDSVYPIIALALPAVSSARTAALRAQSMNNMKQLMLAIHNYHDVNKHLPPAIVMDPESGEKRSWRVELLPYLEEADLYAKYRKDEPWDSPANSQVLAQMPQVFAVAGTTGTQMTPYQAVNCVGGGLTLTKSGKAPAFKDFLDGTSNTVVIVETKLQVPWTQPVDLDADADTPKLRTVREADPGILTGLADGSVRFISENIDASTWQALITRDGGEVLHLDR
ncbi:MAG: DUF1559 domain-containing protein [Planctomycetales bacterium]|nr:DUF1559 domain-containing protein [Planctomycetales bacterium]